MSHVPGYVARDAGGGNAQTSSPNFTFDGTTLAALAVRSTSHFDVAEIATPATPAAGFGRIYAKTDGQLYFKNDAGTEIAISTGATVAGSGVAGQLAFWSSASAIAGDTDLTYNSTTNTLTARTILAARRVGSGDTVFALAANGDEDTGIVFDGWNIGANTLSIYAAGGLVAYFHGSPTNRLVSGALGGANVYMGVGSAALPQFTGTGDGATGFYIATVAGVSTSGVSRQSWSGTQTLLTVPLRGTDGTAAAPSYSFSNSNAAGVFSPAVNVLAFSTTAVERMRIDSAGAITVAGLLSATGTGNINLPNNISARFQIEGSGVGATVTAANLNTLTNGSNADALHVHTVSSAALADGTAAAPSLYFAADTNTGIYRSGADTLAFSANGAQQLTISDVFASSSVRWRMPDGTPTAPAISFNGDTISGFLREGAGTVAIGVSSAVRQRWTSTSSTFTVPLTVTGGVLGSTIPAVSITGTLSTTDATQIGVDAQITSAGSGVSSVYGGRLFLLAGYSGSGSSYGFQTSTQATGTATGGIVSVIGGNFGLFGAASASTTGHNFGSANYAALSSTLNVGSTSFANIVTNSPQRQVGAFGAARHGSIASIGMMATLYDNNSGPTVLSAINASAALVADNADTTHPIFLARDNANTVFTIADGGDVAMGGNHTPLARLHVRDADSSTVLVDATNGASWAEVQVKASDAFIYSYADASIGDVGIVMSPAEGANAAHINIDNLGTAVDLIIQGVGGKAVVFNESGASVDLRVEGGANVNLLFVDASENMVAVAHNAPASRLDVDGSLGLDVTSTSAATFNLDATHHTLLVDASGAAVTVNLPAASGVTRRRYEIKKIDSSANTVTVDGNASETIDGATTKVLTSQYQSMTIVSDGSGWFIV